MEIAPASIGSDRQPVMIPATVREILVEAVGYLRQGKGVSVIPLSPVMTTQEAADEMGFSRPFLVGLLERGEVPHPYGGDASAAVSDGSAGVSGQAGSGAAGGVDPYGARGGG